METQSGLSKNSGLFCANITYFGQELEGINDSVIKKHGYGRMLSIPNKKKYIQSYTIQYEPIIHYSTDVGVYITTVSNTNEIKEWLKQALVLSDRAGYCFALKKKKKMVTVATPVLETETILLSSVLNEKSVKKQTRLW